MRIIKHILLLFLGLTSSGSTAQTTKEKIVVYLIPGQGADERLFKNLELDSTLFETRHITYEIPIKGEDLASYSKRLSVQIDSTKAFHIIGVSLGGMIATEINELLNPKKVIVISSAKRRNELPSQYKFQKYIPIYKIIPKWIIKKSTFIAQPLFEPDRKKEKETFVAMLKDKDPTFLKRTIGMIIKWDRIEYDSNIVHIHGDNDHTLPIKNVNCDYLIKNGSHMMILTRTSEIHKIISSIIL